jgi:ABC-type transport system substrate-binding protein
MKRIAALLLALTIAAVAQETFAQPARPKSGGTLVVGRPTDAISLDPHKATTAPEV